MRYDDMPRKAMQRFGMRWDGREAMEMSVVTRWNGME